MFRTPPIHPIDQFNNAVRAKPNWHLKILDEERNLGEKWVKEAGLREKRSSEVVDAVLRELKREALRIKHLDLVLQPAPVRSADTTDWASIDADIALSVERIREFKYAIRDPGTKEDVGVRTSDDLIPERLKEVLERELDKLADEAVKDFHPGSDGKVQDLIHPSLYPYVHGVTQLIDADHPLKKIDQFESKTLYPVDEYGSRGGSHESIYSWLPSVFSISEDGKVSIDSPINPLGPKEEHPALYAAIERVFQLALPQVEESMFYEWKHTPSQSFRRWKERWEERKGGDMEAFRAKIEKQAKEKPAEEEARLKELMRVKGEMEMEDQGVPLGGRKGKSRFAGQKIKVIVKAANYVLLPGQEHEGSWHVEGAPHERIRASLIYYYSTSPLISDQGLSFRRVRTIDDEPNMGREDSDDFGIEDPANDDVCERDYPSDVEDEERQHGYPGTLPMNLPMGTVRSAGVEIEKGRGKGTGRMLSFPNWLQHKVAGLKNTAVQGNDPALRKILCFFVVNESYPQPEPGWPSPILRFPGFYHQSEQLAPPSRPVPTTADSHAQLQARLFSLAGAALQGQGQEQPEPSPPSALPVPTTADLVPQPRFRLFAPVYTTLDIACKRATGQPLPVELVVHIFELGHVGITRAEAEEHRRKLMDDRRADGVKVNRVWEYDYGLCEH